MNIRFAFAVDTENRFSDEHFGDADKFMIYEVADDKIYFVHSETNLFKVHEEDDHHHGDPKKGNRIVKYFTGKGINVIVAKQFGKNIGIVKNHFLPIIISHDEPVEVKRILSSKLDEVKEHLRNKKESFKPMNGRDWS